MLSIILIPGPPGPPLSSTRRHLDNGYGTEHFILTLHGRSFLCRTTVINLLPASVLKHALQYRSPHLKSIPEARSAAVFANDAAWNAYRCLDAFGMSMNVPNTHSRKDKCYQVVAASCPQAIAAGESEHGGPSSVSRDRAGSQLHTGTCCAALMFPRIPKDQPKRVIIRLQP